MANLMDLLQGQLTESLVGQVSKQFGIDQNDQASSAIMDVFGSMVTAMAKNAKSAEGATALNSALETDHDGSILDNIMGVLSGNANVQNEKAVNGTGILKHVFGGDVLQVGDEISKNTGLDFGKVMSLMVKFAPVVLGLLGKTKKENNLGAGDLFSVLSNTTQVFQKEKPQSSSILNVLLDKNNDGNIIDDLAGSVLKGLFGKK
jgi:hypothetical protein